jgi:hypothetical protein
VQALLNAVLDRFDQQPGESRQQRLHFAAEEQLPALTRLDEDADQLWRFIHQLQDLGLLKIKPAKRGPYDPEWKGARLAFLPQSEQTLRSWLDRPCKTSALDLWRNEVKRQAKRFPHGIDALLERRIEMSGLDDEEVISALASLATIDKPYTLRQLSSLAFAGDSKRLDQREGLIRSVFPDMPLKPRPLVISVHLAQTCRGVLFIENQDTYAEAAAGALPDCRDLALVYAAGFRSGAQRIRDPRAVLLHYCGSIDARGTFEAWWNNPSEPPPGPICFFGDLDFSGMGILAALRERFGEVSAWRPGYSFLVERLTAGRGHHPQTGHKQQSDPKTTGCSYADTVLLPAIRKYGFIDQESFTDPQLKKNPDRYGEL